MKSKLSLIDFNNLKFDSGTNFNQGTLINFNYNETILEFQSPKVTIDSIEDNFFYLAIKPNEACKKFYDKIVSFQDFLKKKYHVSVQSPFDGTIFKVKIPFKNGNPQVRVYSNEDKLFNYYHLTKGDQVICLMSICKLWKANEQINFNLNIKEVMLLKNNDDNQLNKK